MADGVFMSARSRPLPFPPRGLSRAQAASYIGVGVSLFDELVASRAMPPAKVIKSRRVWDRLAIDKAFSALPNADGSVPEEFIWSVGAAPEFVL